MQFLSEKMSRHLSSLAPGFEGHYYYAKTNYGEAAARIVCAHQMLEKWGKLKDHRYVQICPAWQVEDVLRELQFILVKFAGENKRITVYQVAEQIACELALDPDTAYQKIEEYLWTVLK